MQHFCWSHSRSKYRGHTVAPLPHQCCSLCPSLALGHSPTWTSRISSVMLNMDCILHGQVKELFMPKWFVCTQPEWVPGYFTEKGPISIIISLSHLCSSQSLYCNLFYAALKPLSNPAVCPLVIWLLTVGSRIPSLPNNTGKFIQQWVMGWRASQAMSASFVPLAISLRGAPRGMSPVSPSHGWLKYAELARRMSWRRQAPQGRVGLQPPALHIV